ncbi:MAG: pyruvate, phosphate dikinase, partial [Chloroflexota bacterium]|nr:pyruvate, phosphate dikinase [Chloroflexota bacterium]
GLWEAIVENVHALERDAQRRFGDPNEPLVVSVRSGSAVSMPGMMDTILDMGVTDDTWRGLAAMMGDERPALDAYRRFIQGFGGVVLGIDRARFEARLEEAKAARGLRFDYELPPDALHDLIAEFKQVIVDATGAPLSGDPWTLLRQAVEAVFASWNNPRAITYRDFHGISHDMGTGCVIMAMVFGNLGSDSGTGVLFTRSPATGERTLYGEFLTNAQGEDVVAGVRTPARIAQLYGDMPAVYAQLEETARKLEAHYRDVQDIEFTVERGKLYILQTRGAKRTAHAAVKIAVDLEREGVLSRSEAVGRLDAEEVTQVLMPRFDSAAKAEAVAAGRLFAEGVAGSPGAASGAIVFDPDRAVELADQGVKVILVRHETSPDDVHGIIRAEGVLTAKGGMTSHAAVVTRGLGKPAVVGCEELSFENGAVSARGHALAEGDLMSIDGATGEVLVGEVSARDPEADELGDLNTLLAWADELRRLQVWANADAPEDARRARDNGAQGIGLCRTEHMFFDPERLPHVQRMLSVGPQASRLEREAAELREQLAQAPASSRAALAERLGAAEEQVRGAESVRQFHAELAKLEEYQREDFYGILKAMAGLPVVIRLLDAPLHEFLPHYDELVAETVALAHGGADPDALADKQRTLELVEALRESNPM